MPWRDPELLSIGGKSVARGESKTLRLEFARLPTGTVIDTRVHVFRGPEPGPVVMMQGGLHGDEIGGVEILRRMILQDRFAPQRGSVVVVRVGGAVGSGAEGSRREQTAHPNPNPNPSPPHPCVSLSFAHMFFFPSSCCFVGERLVC